MADDTTGTPVAPTEGGAASASGTSVAAQAGGAGVEETPEALKARIEQLESIHKQDLTRLSAGEEARRKLEELEAQQGRLTTPPASYDPNAYQTQQAAQLWQDLQERDPAAAQMIAAAVQASQLENAQTRAEIRWYRELDQVPASDREAVKQRAMKEKVVPSVAHALVKAERYDGEREKLAEQARKLQEEQERLRRGVVSTTAAPAPPAPPNSNEITPEDYAKISRAAYEGDTEARKRVRDVDEGRLKVKPG